jgi:ferric-dicitrate binding protein FerR (iron transport regulator)
MNCEHAENLMAEEIAGELSDTDRAALEGHLAQCERCRQVQAEWREDDQQLRAGFASWRGAGENVAARTIRQLHREQSAPAMAGAPRRWPMFLVGLAAGFLLALVLWRPWGEAPVAIAPPESHDPPPTEVAPPIPASRPVLASVVGNVEVRHDDKGDWVAAQVGNEISKGCEIRTQADGLCEFVCPTGETARLNTDSQMQVHEQHDLELVRGQVWAAGQPERELRLRTPSGTVLTRGGTVNVNQQPEQTIFTVAAGNATVRMVNQEEPLSAGEELTIAGAEVTHRDRAYSLALITAWMNPLLALKSPNDPELNAHVDALLAHLGESKMNLLSETELRTMGESCTTPLVRYLQSDRSEGFGDRRRRAAHLLADLAPVWLAGDIIGLLSDTDGEVRAQAAVCLKRLTGQTMDCPLEHWRAPPDELQQQAIEQWKTWWLGNSFRCAPPPEAKPVEKTI